MTRSYGINERVAADSDIDAAVESLRTLGYAVVDGGYSAGDLSGFSQGSAAPAAPGNPAAIERAASASSPVGKARCWIHRWCGPTKCHRRLWCR